MTVCRLLLTLMLSAVAGMGQQTGSVQGVVINKASRQPVRKAAVTLTSMLRDRSYAVAITDGAGRFSFTGIPGGTYGLQAARNQMYSIPYGATAPRQNGVALNLAAGQTRSGITLQMIVPSAVQGTVADAEGDPLGGVLVELYTRSIDRGKPHYQHRESSVTDARGHYDLSGLMPGEYFAHAKVEFLSALRTRPVVSVGERLQPESVAPQFYPGVDRITSAAPILVADGRDTTGIDFRLNYVPQMSVAGTVSGIPEEAKNLSVILEPEGSPAGNDRSAVRLRVDPVSGKFEAQGLPAGMYRIAAHAGPRRVVQTANLVNARNEVNLALAPGARLSGSLTIEGSAAAWPKNGRITLSPGDDLPGMLQATVENGAFEFDEVPSGVWDIGLRPLPRGSYIKQMRLGDQDVLLEDMQIGPGTKGPLRITVSTNAPKVEGTVEPAGPATVLAAPTGKLAGIFSFYETAQADEKGNFSFNALYPGVYRFYAFHEVEANAWQQAGFLAPYEADAKSFELKEGEKQTVKVTFAGERP